MTELNKNSTAIKQINSLFDAFSENARINGTTMSRPIYIYKYHM